MNVFTGIGIVVLIILVAFLTIRVDGLQHSVNQLQTQIDQLPIRGNEKAVPVENLAPDAPDSQAIIAELKSAIREELRTLVKDENLTSPETDIGMTQKISNPERILTIKLRVDEYLIDGTLTPVELADIENSIIALNPEERREVMNAMVQSMNEQNIAFPF